MSDGEKDAARKCNHAVEVMDTIKEGQYEKVEGDRRFESEF